MLLADISFRSVRASLAAIGRRPHVEEGHRTWHACFADQHGIDHAAHLDQLLPVPAVAGEPRDLARGNGANLAETDLRHHPLKTGALDTACSGTAKIIIDHLDLGPAKCSQAIAHGVLQRAALPVVQNLMSRRLANVEDRFALQMLGADLVRDHDRPPSNRSRACRHGPGSVSSSGWLALPVSPSVVRTTPACRRWPARSLRTGRFAAARSGVPTSVCSGVAWVSPRFWSPGRGDTLESAASNAVERLFRTSRKSTPSITSADKSVWGSTARRTSAQADAAKDNTARPLNCLMNADPQAGPWMPRIQQLPKFGIVGVLKPCCTTRSGPTPQSDTSHQHQRCSCPHSPRGRLRSADRLRRPRWRNGHGPLSGG